MSLQGTFVRHLEQQREKEEREAVLREFCKKELKKVLMRNRGLSGGGRKVRTGREG